MTDLRLVREHSATGWTELASRPAAARLAGHVRGYVGYREDSSVPVRRWEVPTGDIAFILSFGPRIRVLDPAAPEAVWATLGSFVATIGTSPALTEYTGAQFGVQVNLTPIGATMLLGMPMSEFAGAAVELTDALGRTGSRLLERLAEAPGWAARFDLLDEALGTRLALAKSPSPLAELAWRRLVAAEGRLPIARLVEDLGCSHRHLAVKLRECTGVTPKELARVLRARRAIRLLGSGIAFAAVAHDCGFSDQAHLNRDLRRITGATPSAWAAG
ncbi:helix-turn-helix domain-containing protein [Amycolatopsis anabasis]|uniref:helix-turn-helix domain-containing protein n=1 Tax=Amycolatopsis anabasis TaxID=1840409 RepID=UPI00131EC4E6|nr:helix-turn-helix domain-containing protein [Amycolatopsis anabasis]